ncbi:hypothetical protein BKA93DRAFT_751562 [Sparassis latifolia]
MMVNMSYVSVASRDDKPALRPNVEIVMVAALVCFIMVIIAFVFVASSRHHSASPSTDVTATSHPRRGINIAAIVAPFHRDTSPRDPESDHNEAQAHDDVSLATSVTTVSRHPSTLSGSTAVEGIQNHAVSPSTTKMEEVDANSKS